MDVELPERGAALIGDNGQGKTNLLESIYYLEIFRSFRGARDEQLITFGRDHFRVVGHLAGVEGGEGESEVAAGYLREGRRKKVSLDGWEPERVANAIGRVGAIVFTASDIDIVAGGPSARRRFLDILLSLVEPGYLSALQRYRQILAQRNGLLRDRAQREELAAWDDGLVEVGSRIVDARSRWVAASRDAFRGFYAAISGGQAAGVEYMPSVPRPDGTSGGGDATESWAAAFRGAMDLHRERERRRGLTLIGPHRDDLRFWVEEEPQRVALRGFGSAGQQRTAAVALRMVEAGVVRGARGRRPIIMLDDVLAELDPARAERVVELVAAEEWGQVFVTSPKPSELALMGGSLEEFRIAAGKVRRV